MKNPFNPSQIISDPNEFFGRTSEIEALGRQLAQGSIAIQGSFGVGKSSLLSRTLLHMDGFDSLESSSYKLIVGHSDVTHVEKAAQLVLEELVNIDSSQKTLTFGIPKLAQYSSTDAYSLFAEGRHLAALNKILEDKAFKVALQDEGYLIIAVDEVEKCAPAIARLFRQVTTKAQLNGVANLRFVFAGVNPFVESMIREDPGIQRFIYETIDLKPFSLDESREFLDAKFTELVNSTTGGEKPVHIDPSVISRIIQLSGGHPHLLQLLGSHVVEHEYVSPDGVIDNQDLVGSLKQICYQQRAPIYESQIREMQNEGRFEVYLTLLQLVGGDFPGILDTSVEHRGLEKDDIDWFVSRNILTYLDNQTIAVVDELLRVRVIMDTLEGYDEIEGQLIEHGQIAEYDGALHQVRNFP